MTDERRGASALPVHLHSETPSLETANLSAPSLEDLQNPARRNPAERRAPRLQAFKENVEIQRPKRGETLRRTRRAFPQAASDSFASSLNSSGRDRMSLDSTAVGLEARFEPSPAPPLAPLTEYASAAKLVDALRPEAPVHVLRPRVLTAAARWFLQNFPGQTLYAVKVNPHPFVLRTLRAAGVQRFDAASLPEIALVNEEAPGSRIYFMHPVKARAAIRRAYFDYGVRDFALDSMSELFKILEETREAKDLILHVRLALPKGEAFHALDNKFGATPELAGELLRAAAKVARKVGLCFHVGSQTMNPADYARGIERAGEVIREAGVKIASFDLGGGFPVAYPSLTPPPLADYMETIRASLKTLKLPKTTEILAEPGRVLVAEAGSVIVKVELRKDNALYINDGVYGTFFDCMTGLSYPARLLRPRGRAPKKDLQDFQLYGPTCDSLDAMKGPWRLPADIKEGDWIEIGQTGAYGMTMQSRFNGFYSEQLALTADAPQLTTPGYWASLDSENRS